MFCCGSLVPCTHKVPSLAFRDFDRLPERRVSTTNIRHLSQKNCAICMVGFRSGRVVKLGVNCNHPFHRLNQLEMGEGRKGERALALTHAQTHTHTHTHTHSENAHTVDWHIAILFLFSKARVWNDGWGKLQLVLCAGLVNLALYENPEVEENYELKQRHIQTEITSNRNSNLHHESDHRA